MEKRKRVPMTICFSSKQEKEEAIEKCRERGETVSKHIQKHFKNLKPLSPE